MKNKVIKVISLLTAIVTLFSFAACGGDKKDESTTTAKSNDVVQTDVVENESEEAEGEENTEAEEDTEAAEGEEDTEAVEGEEDTEAAEGEEDTEAVVENGTTEKAEDDTTKKTSSENGTTKKNTTEKKTTKKNNSEKTTKKKETTTKKKETTTKKKQYTKAEIVKICTDAINKAKNESPGYTKHKYQKLEGDRSAVPGFYNMLFGLFEEEKTTTYKKGEANKSSFGVDGYVATKVTDPTSINMEIKNGKYVINYKFGNEMNPADLNSRYGRSMDIMTPAEVKSKSVGIISDVNMKYHDGFLTAEIDIATGKLVYMKMGSHVDAEVNKSKPKKAFTVKDIVSIATYTDFKW